MLGINCVFLKKFLRKPAGFCGFLPTFPQFPSVLAPAAFLRPMFPLLFCDLCQYFVIVDQIFPTSKKDINLSELYEIQKLNFIKEKGRSWVVLNMICSLDGSATCAGLSGKLGGAGDKLIFNSLRAGADFILAAANTVRQEKYSLPDVSEEVAARRLSRGQAARARLVVISASLSFPEDAGFLKQSASSQENTSSQENASSREDMPIIYTTVDAPASLKDALRPNAEIREAGEKSVNLSQVASELGEQGNMILVEGGPSLNGQLAELNLIDEICLTVSPLIVTGMGTRIFKSPEEFLRPMELSSVLVDEQGTLFLRWIKNSKT